MLSANWYNSVSQFQTPLLSAESENFPGNIDDGNKTKTIAYRDLKIRRIPSKIMLSKADARYFCNWPPRGTVCNWAP
jgi:hypothetical protein